MNYTAPGCAFFSNTDPCECLTRFLRNSCGDPIFVTHRAALEHVRAWQSPGERAGCWENAGAATPASSGPLSCCCGGGHQRPAECGQTAPESGLYPPPATTLSRLPVDRLSARPGEGSTVLVLPCRR